MYQKIQELHALHPASWLLKNCSIKIIQTEQVGETQKSQKKLKFETMGQQLH